MKTVILLRARPNEEVAPLLALLPGRPWASLASRIVVQLGMASPTEAGGDPVPPVYDAILELWSDVPLADAVAADPPFADRCDLDIRSAQEVVGKEGTGRAPAGTTPGLSQLSFIRTLDGMPRAEAERHWSEHIPLACAIHVGMERYVQDRLSNGDAPWFGMAHLHFPDEAALRDGLFRTPQDVEAISADVAEFVSGHATMLAIEHVLKG